MNREILAEYLRGEQMPASRFNAGGLDIFSERVWPSVLSEQTTRQLDFNKEIWYQKVHPSPMPKTPEEEYLSRVIELKNGTTRLI